MERKQVSEDLGAELEQQLSARGHSASQDTWQCLQTFLIVTTDGVLLASRGKWSETLLNMPQCIGQSLTTNYPVQNVNNGDVEKP